MKDKTEKPNIINNIVEASKEKNVIKKFLKGIQLTQNFDVLKGLSREQRIESQVKKINQAIEDETNPTEKKKLKRILASYQAVQQTMGDFFELNKENGKSSFKKLKTSYKKQELENKQAKKEKVADVFRGEKREAFLKAQDLIIKQDEINISLNRADKEIVEGLPGSEIYFEDLLNDQREVEQAIANLESSNSLELRAAQLISLHEDLGKEGHIARVESTIKNLHEIEINMLSGNSIFLHGPTGTGKTSLARFAAKELTGHDAELVYCNPQTKASDIYGKQKIVNDRGVSITEIDWGPLATALKLGRVCIFDEFTAIPKDQMAMFKAMFSYKVGDDIPVPGIGKIKMKKGFQMIFTSNLKSDKNKERSDLPPEVTNEFAQNNLEINYNSPAEAYDIFLARIMNDQGFANFSKSDLEKDGTVYQLLLAMQDIQLAYQGVEVKDGSNKDSSGKIVSLKKLVMNQRTIAKILEKWPIEIRRNKNLSFLEFLDQRLKSELLFGEYKEDKLLTAKLLVGRGLLSTISAEELGLQETDLAVGARDGSIKKENLDQKISLSRQRTDLSLQDLAELNPFLINIDIKLIDEKGNPILLPEINAEKYNLDKIDTDLQKLGSPARIDRGIESGLVRISLTSQEMIDFNDKNKAFKKLSEANPSLPVNMADNFKSLPYEDIKNQNLDTLIIKHGDNTPAQREAMVAYMDILGYRVPTITEIVAINIKTQVFFDPKYSNIIFNCYTQYPFGSGFQAPFFVHLGSLRKFGAGVVSDDWGDLGRFVFVRK